MLGCIILRYYLFDSADMNTEKTWRSI